jgi:C1A family cysteine protease
MIFLFLFNGFFVSTLQGADTNEYRTGGVLWEDPRTIPWITEAKIKKKRELRASVDHSANMPPVRSQGSQGSCNAWAFGYYYKTYQEWREHGWDVTLPEHQFSPSFIFNQVNGGIDGGVFISDVLKMLLDHGCATLADCPYNAGDFLSWPSDTAYSNAISFRCDSAKWIYCGDTAGISALKSHIAGGDNAVLSVEIWDNFLYIDYFNNVYCVADIGPTFEYQGGHAVCIVGFDDDLMTNDGKGAFKFVNSWGTNWGDWGYGWISYEAVMNDLTSFSWVYYTEDKNNYTPALLAKFEIDHPVREGIRLKMMVGDTLNPDWEKIFFDWRKLEDPACYVTPHSYPANNIVFDLSDADWRYSAEKDTIYLRVKDTLNDGLDGSLLYFGASYNGLSFPPAFDSSETRPIPDGEHIIVSVCDYISVLSINSGFPNPFYDEVSVTYIHKRQGNVEISVNNLIGQRVKNFGSAEQPPGTYTVTWDGINDYGKKVPKGIYFLTIKAEDDQVASKLVSIW